MSRRATPIVVAERFDADQRSARDGARPDDDGAAWALLEVDDG